MPTPRAMPAHRVSISRRMLQRSAACWDIMVIWAPESTKAFILLPFTCRPVFQKLELALWGTGGATDGFPLVPFTCRPTSLDGWASAVGRGKAHR